MGLRPAEEVTDKVPLSSHTPTLDRLCMVQLFCLTS